MRASRLSVLVLLAVLLAAGCGSDGGASSAGGEKRDENSGPKDTMKMWALADTADEECDVLSSGFRFFIGKGEPGQAACVAHVPSVLGKPAAARLTIHKISTDHGQTLVDATVGDTRTVFYLVKQDAGWRINSIGIREGLGPPLRPGDLD